MGATSLILPEKLQDKFVNSQVGIRDYELRVYLLKILIAAPAAAPSNKSPATSSRPPRIARTPALLAAPTAASLPKLRFFLRPTKLTAAPAAAHLAALRKTVPRLLAAPVTTQV